MGRGKPRVDRRGPLKRVLDAEVAAIAAIPHVTEFHEQHGCYERNLRSVVNRGGTPIARWRKLGILSDTQNLAIDHCIALWDAITPSGGLVANLDRTVFGCPGNGRQAEVLARDDLQRMKGYVPATYWSCFENVVRFDEPAGVAGSRLMAASANREITARLCVQFVADIVAMKERLVGGGRMVA